MGVPITIESLNLGANQEASFASSWQGYDQGLAHSRKSVPVRKYPCSLLALIVTLPTASTLPPLETIELPELRGKGQASNDSSWQGYDQGPAF